MRRSSFAHGAICLLIAALLLCAAGCAGASPAESTLTQTFTEADTQTTTLPVEETTEPDSTVPEIESAASDSPAMPIDASIDMPTSAQVPAPSAAQTTAQATAAAAQTAAPTAASTAAAAQTAAATATTPASTAHVHAYKTETTPATCTDIGRITKTCSCGDVQVEFLEALGHNYGDPVVVEQVTCTEMGKTVSKCSRCGEEKETLLFPTGHQMTEYVVKEATHEAAGLKTKRCSRCGMEENEVIPRLLPYCSMEEAEEMLRLMNASRVEIGAEPLAFNYTYYPAAEIRSGEIETSFSHTRPNGKPFYTALDDVGLEKVGGMGENAQMSTNPNFSMQEGHTRLMNSPGHRSNILNTTYHSVSVCVRHTETGVYIIQMFFSKSFPT